MARGTFELLIGRIDRDDVVARLEERVEEEEVRLDRARGDQGSPRVPCCDRSPRSRA
jgi:hypothetical protein